MLPGSADRAPEKSIVSIYYVGGNRSVPPSNILGTSDSAVAQAGAYCGPG
jgi:hypothetical protein